MAKDLNGIEIEVDDYIKDTESGNKGHVMSVDEKLVLILGDEKWIRGDKCIILG